MKKIIAFYLTDCPYCKKAKEALQELKNEYDEYRDIMVEWHEEMQEPEMVTGYTYTYVPVMYWEQETLYEAQPGQTYDEIKAFVKAALDKVAKKG